MSIIDWYNVIQGRNTSAKNRQGSPFCLYYRFDENTKLIAVGGSHAIGKTKFAKELAEELDMLYFQYPSITNTMIDSYGVDMRQYNENMVPIFRVGTKRILQTTYQTSYLGLISVKYPLL